MDNLLFELKTNKNYIKKVVAGALCLIAIIMILSGILQGDSEKIIGKWETDPGRKDARVYEFYNDNTGVDYRNLTNGETYNAESFNYKINGENIVIDYGIVSKVYSYEISGKELLLDGKIYTKTDSGNKMGSFQYIVSVALIVLAIYIYKGIKRKED